jgi:hypothetical protein
MLGPAAVEGLRRSLFGEVEQQQQQHDGDEGVPLGTTDKGRGKKSGRRRQPRRRLSAPREVVAVPDLVLPSHKSDANDFAVSTRLDQHKRDYLSAAAMRYMSSKSEWVGSPSSTVSLSFSRTANYHILSKQDILQYDGFRRNPKFNNIIARGAYLQKFERPSSSSSLSSCPRNQHEISKGDDDGGGGGGEGENKEERRVRRRELGFTVPTPVVAAAQASEQRRMRSLRRSLSDGAVPMQHQQRQQQQQQRVDARSNANHPAGVLGSPDPRAGGDAARNGNGSDDGGGGRGAAIGVIGGGR